MASGQGNVHQLGRLQQLVCDDEGLVEPAGATKDFHQGVLALDQGHGIALPRSASAITRVKEVFSLGETLRPGG